MSQEHRSPKRLGAPFLEHHTLDPLAFFASSSAALYYPQPPLELSHAVFLGSSYTLSAPSQILGFEGPKLQMGWHEEGIALQVVLEGEDSSVYRQFDLYIDTRDRKDAKSLARSCHHFAYSLKGCSKRDWTPILGQERTRLAGTETRPLADPITLKALCGNPRGKEVLIRCWIPAVALYGYDPDLFGFIGLHARLAHVDWEWRFCCAFGDINAEGQPGMWTSLRLQRRVDRPVS